MALSPAVDGFELTTLQLLASRGKVTLPLPWPFYLNFSTSNFLLKKWANPASFSFISVFTSIAILTTNKNEKNPSSIQGWDSNSQPSDDESPPLTTRPGLPFRSIALDSF